MKKLKLFFALFAMLALGVGNAWGDEVTFNCADYQGKGTQSSGSSYTMEKSGMLSIGNTKFYGNTSYAHFYANGNITVTPATGVTITKIVLTASTSSYNGYQSGGTITASAGTISGSGTTVTWTGSAANAFTLKNNKQIRWTKIVVTYTPSTGGGSGEGEGEGEGGTGTINFGSANGNTKINAISVTGSDNLSNEWTITTVTSNESFTQNQSYSQVGASSKPATSITFTTTLPQEGTITDFSAKFGGFSGTAGTVTLKVDDTSVGTGSLNATSDVTISNSSQATGKKLTVTVTGIAKGVKVYYISYTYTTSSGGSEPETPATELTNDQFAWSAATAEATMGASNTFPTLTNTLPVSVTYESVTPATATIDATSGAITLVAPGTTTISAKFAGGEVSGTTYAPKTVTYALTVFKAPATPTENMYAKVTDAVTDGEYLIVYEDGKVAFNGALTTLDAVSNTVEVVINSNSIAGNTEIDAATFTIDATAGTIQSASGYYIGKTASGNGLNTDKTTAYTNTITIDADKNAVVKSSGGSILRYNKASDQARFRYYGSGQQAITLYKKVDPNAVVEPAFTPVAGEYYGPQSVTISCATAGAEVYYTLDGTDPTSASTKYTGAISIASTTTVKAIAVKGANSSEVVSATYTILAPLATIQAIFDKATAVGGTATPVHITMNNWVVTGVKNNNVYVTDGTKGLIIYTASHGFNVGDILSGTVACKVQLYNGSSELTELTSTTEGLTVTTGGVVTPVEVTDITTLGGVNTGSVIKITGPCTVDGTKYYVAGVQLYNSLYTYTNPEDGYNYECTGVYLQYNTTKEILPRKAEDLVKIETQQPAGIKFETTEYTANVNEAFTAPTLTNPNGLTVTYSTSDATLATVNTNTGAVTIGNKTGKVTITASFAGNEDYVAADASYNITITDPSVSEATFVAGTDKSDTKSISKNGITVEFTDGTFSRDDNYRCYANQSMTISYADGNITKIVIECTANDGAEYGPGQFTTETATYSYSGKVGTWTGEANSVTFTNIKQVRMTAITVYYKQDTRTPAGLAWNPATVSLTVGEEFTAPTFSNPNSVTGVTFTSDNEALATVTSAGVVTLKSGVTGKATITAKFDGNSDYKDATVTCTITVNPKTETVVILAKYGDQWYALKNVEVTAGKVLAALPVNYVGGKLYNVEEADKATIEWQRAAVTDGIIFKNGENYISGTAGDTDLKLSTTECAWTLDGSTYKIGNRTFIYRAQANGFKNYNATTTPGTDDYSNLPVVTAPVYTTGEVPFEITTTAENGTAKGSGVYKAGEKVILTADPALDYTFVNWTKGGEVVSIANPFVFEATENLDLVANFQKITATTKTLTGKFSVGEYKYAEFATGNLQYTNGTWGFAKQQYQYVGEANINVGDHTFTGTIDMFGWSTNETNYGVDPRNVNEFYDGEFVDWGDLFPVEDNWSTLSADQWKYILNKRTNASSLKQIARVGSVVGIMLFPDNWNAPLTVTAQHDSYFDVDIHNYTLDQWAALENAGALFLPAAGRRAGGHGNMINKDQVEETNPDNLNDGHYKHYDNGNIYCYYWTSTINESTKDVSYLHNIQALGGDEYTIGTGAIWGEKGRYGQSVRLAKVTDIIRKELTVGQLGTVCLPYNIPSGQVYGATFYTLAGKMDDKVVFNEVTGELAAGVPYLFQASAEEISCFPGTTIVTEPNNSGAMKGTFVKMTLTELTDIYYFAGRALWSCVDLTSLSVPANRAYVNMAEVTAITGAAPVGVRRITLGVNGQNTATGVDQVQGDNVPTKMIINGQLFILRGEKMYDAQGKLVK